MVPHFDTAPEPRPAHRRRRRAVAALLAAALALVLPVALPAEEADSAPKFNVPCETLTGVTDLADWAELPGGGRTTTLIDDADNYEYENPAEKWRTENAPSQQELDGVPSKKAKSGTKDHLIQSWKKYLGRQGKLDWADWLNNYIPNQANDFRGDGYQKSVAKFLKLGGPDWICEDTELWQELELDKERRFDSVNRRHKIVYELKSGSSAITDKQLRLDKQVTGKGWKVVYITTRKLQEKTVTRLGRYGVTHATLRANGVLAKPGASASTAMNTPKATTNGPVKNIAAQSGSTPTQAKQVQQLNNQLRAESSRPGMSPVRPGGIDWTSLELRYVSDDPKSDDLAYSFAAAELPDDGAAEPGYGGEAALDLSSDALMTWLALDPGQFWVNLNPDTPETIIDEQFATTDAGRVLLEADLAFKRTIADGMDPDTETGNAFWESMERTDEGLICHDWFRFWVDPKPATVREDGNQLYILDAPLRAQIEPVEVDWEMPGQDDSCESAPQDVVDHNNQLLVDTYAPLLEESVNTDPRYADLRRVYTARVVAQWLRERDAERPGAYHEVIGSGDVSDWPARTEWDPRDVFDDYMERLQTPLYRYEWTHGDLEYWLEITGGVMLPDTPRDAMSKGSFEEQHPELPRAAQAARYDVASVPAELAGQDDVTTLADETDTAWLGGGTYVAPAPVPTDPPEPTDPPGGDDGAGGGDGDGGGPDDGRATVEDEPTPDARPARPDDPAARGDERPAPSRADAAQPGQATTPAMLASTGFGDVGLMVAAIVLVLVGLVLVGIRRRWFPRS
ncbi:hypothetical protein [Isoptericola sp. NPDC019482]|uniref:hypothetical protein n=1 Tax=Isoptericola sp. NPDC019482 TaxID=3154688 RepID=UPI0034728AEA